MLNYMRISRDFSILKPTSIGMKPKKFRVLNHTNLGAPEKDGDFANFVGAPNTAFF